MSNTQLKKISQKSKKLASSHGVIKLLIADHRLLRSLMKKVKSQKSSDLQKMKFFKELVKVVKSHVTAEESTFLSLIKDNPIFKNSVLEGYEEHRVHETVLAGISKVKNQDRKIEQMKIFCEILKHHLDEEESELFPKFKKYIQPSTRKKIGKNFLKIRRKSNKTQKNRGAMRFS